MLEGITIQRRGRCPALVEKGGCRVVQAVTVAWLGWMSMDGRAGIWRKGKKRRNIKEKKDWIGEEEEKSAKGGQCIRGA